MKLRALRIHGFKSFADRTEVRFHDGITAIVGPNGCGKSNISDAIRWVLGEQRPGAIRGARMEEAIFQGTVHRRPVNRGSVGISVSNEDGRLPVPFEEVEIARTVFRDGGSEYSINRASCRLRDIHDLCRDTGLGANAYSIIESRMIDTILSDRAEERRSLFEEAAGIGKYKDRRKAALRRLERAELDLERVDDVIAEVQSKVRSLARQKGKAERFQELRDRRLALDVTVVAHELEAMDRRLAEIRRGLEGGRQDAEGLRAELAAAEVAVELLRGRRIEAERARSTRAGELEQVRAGLGRWERELAVSGERATAASRRLERIGEERGEAGERLSILEEEGAILAFQLEDAEARVEELREALTRAREASSAVRSRLQEARSALDAFEARERELARRGAHREGDANGLEAQAQELVRRLEAVERELSEVEGTVLELEAQGDLFTGRIETLTEGEERAREGVEEATGVLATVRARREAAEAADRAAADALSRVESRREALEALERGGEGIEPAVRGATALGDPGVLGPLGDFLSAPRERAAAVEAFLGPRLRGLVVRDAATVTRLALWFREEWRGGGGLLLLPLDGVGVPADRALPEGVRARGEGAPWVECLLGGARWDEDGDGFPSLANTPPRGAGAPRGIILYPRGGAIDGLGIVHLGDPLGSTGILERREELEALRIECERLEGVAADARRERAAAREAVARGEGELDRARAALRQAEDQRRELRAEVAAQAERRVRADRLREELVRRRDGTLAARDRALEQAHEARLDRAAIREEEAELAGAGEGARERVHAVQEEWEGVRAEESRLAVDLARHEGEAGRLRERLAEGTAARGRARDRIAALDREEADLRAIVSGDESLRATGESELERLFELRTSSEEALRLCDAELQTVEEGLSSADARVRASRTAERATTELHHRLELEERELEGERTRLRERLELEWARPIEELLTGVVRVEGEPDALRSELGTVVAALGSLGPVNQLAVEEHEEESNRLAFLTGQHADLLKARDDLRAAIREINQTATRQFMETFDAIRTYFRETFQRLFQGGECDLWMADPDDPLESPIEIHASPVGKRTQRIDLLSGGERALTALSLLFGIYLVKPSPFCVLDEVDAPLDESNIGRFIRLLQEFKADTQFVVITHNPRTIEAADWIYGVTMEEPGVSTIVGVRLEEALQAAGISA